MGHHTHMLLHLLLPPTHSFTPSHPPRILHILSQSYTLLTILHGCSPRAPPAAARHPAPLAAPQEAQGGFHTTSTITTSTSPITSPSREFSCSCPRGYQSIGEGHCVSSTSLSTLEWEEEYEVRTPTTHPPPWCTTYHHLATFSRRRRSSPPRAASPAR